MTESATITIAGKRVSVGQPYTPGDLGRPLSAGEANALNKYRTEKIRANFTPKIKEGKISDDELQAAIASYDSTYSFDGRALRGPTASRDPVEVEARSLVTSTIKTRLAELGQKADSKAIAAAVQTILDSLKGESFRASARINLEQKRALSASMSDLLPASLGQATSAPQATA